MELDRARTSTISSISYINEKNRKLNIELAEKAIMEEYRANKGNKVMDPFTRRSTRPSMVTKRVEVTSVITENPFAVKQKEPENKVVEIPKDDVKKVQSKVDDLYLAHNFDIKIDLDVPSIESPMNTITKSVSNAAKEAPRRSLNLEDYKKKRGLL